MMFDVSPDEQRDSVLDRVHCVHWTSPRGVNGQLPCPQFPSLEYQSGSLQAVGGGTRSLSLVSVGDRPGI